MGGATKLRQLAPRKTEQVALLREMFEVAIESVSPDLCIPPYLPKPSAGKTLVLGVGKAGASMVRAAMRHLSGQIEGIILTRYGHGFPHEQLPPNTIAFEAGHPLPDEQGLNATLEILKAVKALGKRDRLLALISGGGSSLLTMPAPGVTLSQKQEITKRLLYCGASISEINCVRSHLSGIKGGRLALAARPAKVITLAISDIPGNDPALIASGPTVADRTTLADARRILKRYEIPLPRRVAAALADPGNETPTAKDFGPGDTVTKVVARSQDALEAAGQLANAASYTPVYLGSDLQGDATEVGIIHAALALHHARKGGRWALLSGGETTVVVRNPRGCGGRNTEYLTSLAIALDGAPGISALACDTDGIDGSEDNAGAIIDPTTLARARKKGLSASDALEHNVTYDFFAQLGDLVKTGPTRTNVNDLRIILIDR